MTDAIRDGNHIPVALGVSSADASVTTPFVVDGATGKLQTANALGGTSPVADGTYTVGNKITAVTGSNGTITTKNGIITAIQQAT